MRFSNFLYSLFFFRIYSIDSINVDIVICEIIAPIFRQVYCVYVELTDLTTGGMIVANGQERIIKYTGGNSRIESKLSVIVMDCQPSTVVRSLSIISRFPQLV